MKHNETTIKAVHYMINLYYGETHSMLCLLFFTNIYFYGLNSNEINKKDAYQSRWNMLFQNKISPGVTKFYEVWKIDFLIFRKYTKYWPLQ
jgi:hypothetical protein